MSNVTPPRSELDRRMDEFDLARRALRWMLEHRVYWDHRSLTLRIPGGMHGGTPFVEAPADIQIFLLSLMREIDLDAEHAS